MEDFGQIPLANTQVTSSNNDNNMGTPMQAYANSVILSFVGVLVFVGCVLGGMWFHRLYSTRGFHMADFGQLSGEARALARETSLVRRDVEDDYSSNLAVKMVRLQRVHAAEELDVGVRVALGAWEDLMRPDEEEGGDGGSGSGGGKTGGRGRERERERRRSHGRYVIGLMRGKCLEGVERRKELSRGLQAMHLEVLSRKIDVQSSRINRRSASGSSKHEIPRKAMPERFRSLSHTQPSIESSSTHDDAPGASSPSTLPHHWVVTSASGARAPAPKRAASCPVPEDERYEMLGPVQKERTYV